MAEEVETSDLSPCPFCGGVAQERLIVERYGDIADRGFCIECRQCLASTRLHYCVGKDDPRPIVRMAWNNRAALNGKAESRLALAIITEDEEDAAGCTKKNGCAIAGEGGLPCNGQCVRALVAKLAVLSAALEAEHIATIAQKGEATALKLLLDDERAKMHRLSFVAGNIAIEHPEWPQDYALHVAHLVDELAAERAKVAAQDAQHAERELAPAKEI